MLAVIPLMTGALVLTAFDNVFPSFFSIITAHGVLTGNIDFSSWSRHGVHQENGSVAYYNKLSYIRTLPKPRCQSPPNIRRIKCTVGRSRHLRRRTCGVHRTCHPRYSWSQPSHEQMHEQYHTNSNHSESGGGFAISRRMDFVGRGCI